MAKAAEKPRPAGRAAARGETASKVMCHSPMTFASTHVGRRGNAYTMPKRHQVSVDGLGQVRACYANSPNCPDFMQQALRSARSFYESQGAESLPTTLRPRQSTGSVHAAGLHRFAASEKGKKHLIVLENTGKVCGKGLVSDASPDWFQASIKSNQSYFKEKGLSPRKLEGAQTQRPATAGDLEKNNVHNVASKDAPDWMRVPLEHNKPYLERRGMPLYYAPRRGSAAGCVTQRLSKSGPGTGGSAPALAAPGDAAGVVSRPPDSLFGGGVVVTPAPPRPGNDREAGQDINATIHSAVSPCVPEWMKSPFDSNRQYFESKGVPQHLQNTAALKDGFDQSSRRGAVLHHKSGKVLNKTMVSGDAPSWILTQASDNKVSQAGGPRKQGRKPSPMGKRRAFKPPSRQAKAGGPADPDRARSSHEP